MSQKKATIVNLAASHVSVSVFGTQAGGLVLERFHAQEIRPGLTNDDEWLNVAIAALAELVSTHAIKGVVTVVAPSFLLLQKALKVPQVERQRQAQIVAFEAQNAIPYPLNEVIWDSQVMASDGVEAEVLLFALRTEFAVRIANMVGALGLRPLRIQAAPLLDSQAFLLAGAAATEEVLIINVGARTTTLSFIGPSGANIQSANLGGNLLTQGISDGATKGFGEAEALKVGYFSGIIHLAESDPLVPLLQANAQTFGRRLAQDVNRRLINIRRGAAGRQPTRVLLAGRGSLVPGLVEQLTETLRLPVEFFDSAAILALGAAVDPEHFQQCRHQVSEVVGEASSLLLPQVGGINLIPRDIADQISFDARKPFLLTAALLVALAPLPVWYASHEALDYNREQAAELNRRQNELKTCKVGIEELRKKADEVRVVNQQLESVVLNSANWPSFLADLQVRVAGCKNTWVDELRVRREAAASVPRPEGEASPAVPAGVAPMVTKVVLTARFLLPEVAPGRPLNARAMTSRQQELIEALRQSPFVQEIPDQEIRPDFTQANTPRITFTLIIRSDKAL